MAISNDDLAKAEVLLNELPGIKSAIDNADALTDDQLAGLLGIVEAASAAMNEPDGSARQEEITNELIRINDAINDKLEAAKDKEGE